MRSPWSPPGAALLAALALASPTAARQGPAACAADVERQLAAWGIQTPARPQPVTGAGLLRHWPTARLGEWVVEARDAAGTRLRLVTPATITTRAWSATCAATESAAPRRSPGGPRFTDDDLRALVAGGRGVVYVWSPHMPLSVEGYRPIVEAAAARGLAVTAVLDPGADRRFAEAERQRGDLPAAALRVADSVELLFRDVLIHAPAVQAYGNGGLAGSAFPGFHTAAEYGAFLDRVLPPAR